MDARHWRQNYIHHQARDRTVALFVRTAKQDESGRTLPYFCAGTASYVEHRSERPIQITWKLHHPLPGDIFTSYRAAVVLPGEGRAATVEADAGGTFMTMHQLVVSGVCKRFGRTTILEDVDLAVARGEVVALTGENGAGKSTLMGICAGLIRADSGTVQLGGAIGYCPQTPGLFDLLTAEDHLVMFGRGSGLGRAESLRRGYAALEEFGYPMHERTVVADLSGGTRQKLNLALALLTDPSVLLLDEPYQGFDRGTYVNFWDHCETWRRAGKSVVVVTHMLAELDRVDRVVELPAHPSRAHHPGR